VLIKGKEEEARECKFNIFCFLGWLNNVIVLKTNMQILIRTNHFDNDQ
jgi:hypothetical protein